MQLRLKTKITLIMAFLMLAVVGVNSTLYVMTLTRQVIRQADNRASLVTQQVFFQAQNALADADLYPKPNLWVLEMAIRHPTRQFGAFYEDLLLDDQSFDD